MALAGFGTLLTAGYLLSVVRRVCMGDPRSPHLDAAPQAATPQAATSQAAAPRPADVQAYEFAAWTPLVALIVLAGLWPAALLGLSNPAVTALLGGH